MIGLIVIGGTFGYIFMGMGMHWFLYNIRSKTHSNWTSNYWNNERVIVSSFWPIAFVYFTGWYFIALIVWMALFSVRPIKVSRARAKRSGRPQEVK